MRPKPAVSCSHLCLTPVFAYRFLISVFALVTLASALRRGDWGLLRARLGRAPAPTAPRPHLWLHGASNGELISARPVVQALTEARPDLGLLITANNPTGVEMVRNWRLPGVTALPAPVDLSWVSRGLMRRWRVVAHVTLESELWPHRVLACPGPVIVLGARMTKGTARGWARLPRLAQRVLARMAFVSAQDTATRDRLLALGLPESAAGPVTDLKSLYRPPEMTPDAPLLAAFARSTTWLAASTHESEETVVLKAFALARRQEPALRLILAPRHVARGDAVATKIAATGLSMARRSKGEAPEADVYLADTMGEMPLWYQLAGRVFIGGTLLSLGGHTPYEPAAFGCALQHGPDVVNHRAPFARLAGIAQQIDDAESLARALAAQADPETQRRLGTATRDALRQEADLDALMARVTAQLPAPGDLEKS